MESAMGHDRRTASFQTSASKRGRTFTIGRARTSVATSQTRFATTVAPIIATSPAPTDARYSTIPRSTARFSISARAARHMAACLWNTPTSIVDTAMNRNPSDPTSTPAFTSAEYGNASTASGAMPNTTTPESRRIAKMFPTIFFSSAACSEIITMSVSVSPKSTITPKNWRKVIAVVYSPSADFVSARASTLMITRPNAIVSPRPIA